MILTICNERISLSVDTLGAQMMHLQQADGTEYLWQGDPAYWKDRAPVLFPFIARLTDNTYRLSGEIYHMGIHGFAAASEFVPVEQGQDRLVLELRDNDRTRAQYPFRFVFQVIYGLRENTVEVTYRVRNLADRVMPFGIGGHPGFRVPVEEKEQFEDYRIEFPCCCQPDRVGFTPQVYVSGHNTLYPLEEGRYLPLTHSLFDADAIILQNMAREVTLRSTVSGRGVRVSFPDMPYLGFWHRPESDAPYVCIEPWSSLPSRQGVVEELTCRSDLIRLAPGGQYENTWTISVL